MKSLLIVRHAKSSWEWDDLNDFERPLSDRGKHDAPMMAQRMIEAGADPDLLISSPAKRAKKTALLFAGEWRIDEDAIQYKSELYHAATDVFYEVIEKINPYFETVALFSHNPGITAFVNGLTQIRVDNMPTCGIYGLRITSDQWSDFRTAPKKFWLFDHPKA